MYFYVSNLNNYCIYSCQRSRIINIPNNNSLSILPNFCNSIDKFIILRSGVFYYRVPTTKVQLLVNKLEPRHL